MTTEETPVQSGDSHRIFWRCCWIPCWLWMTAWYRYRCFGARNIPRTGGVLFVANHQSFFDPIVIGLGTFHRPFRAMARATLFDNPKFAWLIRSLGAIPVRQGAGDKAAIKACIDALKAGQMLLVFPEGARTLDGDVHEFAPGTMLLIKRARPMVVPVAVEGVFDVWRRGQSLPHPTGITYAQFGEPIPADKLVEMGAEAGLKHLRDIVEGMRQELRSRMPVIPQRRQDAKTPSNAGA